MNLVAVELEEHAKGLPRVGVVFDESDPPRRTRGRRLRRDAPRDGGGERGKADREDAPRARAGALRVHGTAVKLDEPLDQGQADPEAAAAAIQGALALDEQVEDAREELGTYAHAAVLHPKHRPGSLAPDLDVNRAACGRVAEGVLHEIEYHLLDPRGVAVDPHGLTGQGDGMITDLAGRAQCGQRVIGGFVEVEGAAVELDLARHDPPDVEEVVDQSSELLHLAGDDLAGVRGGDAVRIIDAVQDVHGIADGPQRVAELVTQHGQELVLETVGRLGLVPGRLGVPVQPGVVDGGGGPVGERFREGDIGVAIAPVRFRDDEGHGAEHTLTRGQRHHHPGSEAQRAEHGELLRIPRRTRYVRFRGLGHHGGSAGAEHGRHAAWRGWVEAVSRTISSLAGTMWI